MCPATFSPVRSRRVSGTNEEEDRSLAMDIYRSKMGERDDDFLIFYAAPFKLLEAS